MGHSDFLFGWEVNGFVRDEHVIVSENFFMFSTLLCVSLLLQYYVSDVWKLRYLPASAATMLFAIAIGGLIHLLLVHHKRNYHFSPLVLGFSTDVFYFGFLPPIIFSSGFHLRRKLFFGNLGAVLALAFVGTLFATVMTGIGIYSLNSLLLQSSSATSLSSSFDLTLIESIAFGCLLSSTDPISTLAVFSSLKVDPTLFYAVLGESVLNDAVAITAFKLTSRLIGSDMVRVMDGVACAVDFCILVAGSSFIGYTFGLCVAWSFRQIDFSVNKIVPVSIFVATVYAPFFLSEMLQLSGIVTIFFSGIAARRYVYKNLAHDGRLLAAYVFQIMAHLAETSCFVLLGLSVFLVEFPLSELPFMFGVLAICIAARALSVYPLMTMLNIYRRWRLHKVESTPIGSSSVAGNNSHDRTPIAEKRDENNVDPVRVGTTAAFATRLAAQQTMDPSLSNRYVPLSGSGEDTSDMPTSSSSNSSRSSRPSSTTMNALDRTPYPINDSKETYVSDTEPGTTEIVSNMENTQFSHKYVSLSQIRHKTASTIQPSPIAAKRAAVPGTTDASYISNSNNISSSSNENNNNNNNNNNKSSKNRINNNDWNKTNHDSAPKPMVLLPPPVSMANMHMIFFAGMRGVVSFSLAYIFPDEHGNRNLVLCTTVLIILVTSILQGCLTEPLIHWLGIETNVNVTEYIRGRTRSPRKKNAGVVEDEDVEQNRNIPTSTRHGIMNASTRSVFSEAGRQGWDHRVEDQAPAYESMGVEKRLLYPLLRRRRRRVPFVPGRYPIADRPPAATTETTVIPGGGLSSAAAATLSPPVQSLADREAATTSTTGSRSPSWAAAMMQRHHHHRELQSEPQPPTPQSSLRHHFNHTDNNYFHCSNTGDTDTVSSGGGSQIGNEDNELSWLRYQRFFMQPSSAQQPVQPSPLYQQLYQDQVLGRESSQPYEYRYQFHNQSTPLSPIVSMEFLSDVEDEEEEEEEEEEEPEPTRDHGSFDHDSSRSDRNIPNNAPLSRTHASDRRGAQKDADITPSEEEYYLAPEV